MSEGCTNCGNKGGCDSRKHGMFGAIDDALARLYPTRRWGERDDLAALEDGIPREEGEALAAELARRMGTAVVFRPGEPEEWCDYVYVLCLGRTPCIAELRASLELHASDAGADGPHAVPWPDDVEDGGAGGLDELYLRVALSSVARFAGVQEVAMSMRREGEGEDLVITETARSGVFNPILLPRFQALVACLARADIRHLDFGEIVEAPEGFHPGDHAERFGAEPVIANYLFYPQSPTAVSTIVVQAPVATLTAPASS
jgi:hypothetical protein